MFKISKYHKVPTDIPIITSEYKVLHFDQMPILYTGRNRYGDIILGSSVEEDYDLGVERHFCVRIDLAMYSAFVSGAVTYRDVLNASRSVFVIDSSFDGATVDTYYLPVSRIPNSYLPSKDSICPPQPVEESLSLELYASLSGGLADKHMAVPSELNKMQEALTDAVDSIWDVLKGFVDPNIYVRAYEKSSFGIYFQIQLPDQQHINTLDYVNFYRRVLRYSFNYLPLEMPKIIDPSNGVSTEFEELLGIYAGLHGVEPFSDADRTAHLRRDFVMNMVDVASELRNVSESIGAHFSRVNIFDDVSGDIANVVGVINEDFRDKITDAVDIASDAYSSLDEDTVPQQYSIQIYSFNTKSRKGIAQVIATSSSGDRMLSTARILVLGTHSLKETKFTASLDRQVVIDVFAIAYRDHEKIFKMKIVEEV